MSVTDVKSPRLRQGLETRRAVLSDAYVERVEAATTEFDEPFQALITEAAWGHLWSRNEWSKRERSIVTIALLAALGHTDELAMHIRATSGSARSAQRRPRWRIRQVAAAVAKVVCPLGKRG